MRMAKAKTTSQRTSGSARRPGARAGVGKGELEIGNARRESGGAGPTRPAVSRTPPRKASAQLPGEKAVKRTSKTLPVEPGRPAPGRREPMPAPALDRRRQVVGTDELRQGRRDRR
jgi:hypothetical protein